MNVKQLRETVDNLFGKRGTLMMRWQEIAENFYPERADFTLRREVGDQFAENLTTSYPVMCRRDLGDQIGTMLRPTAKPWFHLAPTDTGREDNDAKRWLEWAATVQRRAMYDRVTRFNRATKEGDHDFSAFGQAALSVRMNRDNNALLYRCWHLRDVVWMEDEEGEICLVARKWKPHARDLKRIFAGNNHPSLNQKAEKTPFQEIECYHIVVESEMYDGNAQGKPYWSIYVDITHDHTLEAKPVWNREYFIPRWQTVSGSQYAFSPATIVGLPDARLIQSMAYTLLEAGEKAVNPPMVATVDAVRSDISIYAGGTTWIDNEYDERLGEALRPMNIDSKGMPLGLEMQQDARSMIAQAFFLNKLTLPQRTPEMTAYEVGQRIQEYIRGAMPIFEPMEMDYNGQLCEMTFDLLMRGGAFGSPQDMPKSLQGADIQFRFESPLHDAIEQQKGQKFLEMNSIIAQAVQLDQSVAALPDMKVTVRDVLEGIKVPAEWIRSEADVEEIERQQQQDKAEQDLLAQMQQGSETVKNIGGAAKDLQAANVL